MAQDSYWQRLFDAVKVRMQSIHTANGYETDLGTHAFTWRDLGRSPFTAAEAPCFMIRDPRRETNSDGVINAHDHRLSIEMIAVAYAGESSPPDNFARRMLSDIDQAIGVDRQWSVDGVALARDTVPGEDAIEGVHAADRMIVVRKTFTILFRTRRFNPYAQ